MQEEKEFRSILPKTGFIPQYMKYTDRQESPGCFHFWTMATVIGAIIQRRAWVSKGIYNIYPNFYTILTAPSGICRKSRAINLALDLVSEFDWLNPCADKTTPEALLQALMIGTRGMEQEKDHTAQPMAENSGIIPGAELSVFINKSQPNSGMITLLTHLYDCPPSFRYLTRNKRPIILKNVCLSLIGGTTPDWLASNLPADAFEGGFMSRIMFVVKSQRDRIIALPSEPDPQEAKDLRMAMVRIRTVAQGKFAMTPEAIAWYEQWYEGMQRAKVDDLMLLGFFERKQDILLKIALILAACEGRNTIGEADMDRAHMIVTWTQERMFHAFKNVHLSENGQLSQKIMDFVGMMGGAISRREVLRKFGGRLRNGVQDLENIERVLVEGGQIALEERKGHGVPSIWYVMKERNQDGG